MTRWFWLAFLIRLLQEKLNSSLSTRFKCPSVSPEAIWHSNNFIVGLQTCKYNSAVEVFSIASLLYHEFDFEHPSDFEFWTRVVSGKSHEYLTYNRITHSGTDIQAKSSWYIPFSSFRKPCWLNFHDRSWLAPLIMSEELMREIFQFNKNLQLNFECS